jgi:hypothetical protein
VQLGAATWYVVEGVETVFEAKFMLPWSFHAPIQ